MKVITPLVISLALAATLTVQSALHAQPLPIQPAADGTGTIVNSAGNTFNITGGTTSSSGANLFQSFTNFGLSNGQVANFLSAPNTQNILSRVTGGSFSLIDGLLKVTGSNANLFLLNPSGIIFGPNASLNVPAAFTATTANGIAFGSQWFNALGPNNYASLNGSPSSLGFTMSKPGAIVNAGNLSVGPGQALSLIGGTVASTGQLSGGQVTVAAVPGEQYVRLGQPGSPLSIEVPMSGAQMPTNWDLPIYSLPELLTGTDAGLTVADDGTVHLVGSQLTVESGDVVARKIGAESAVLSASRNVTLPESQLKTAKDLLIQAKDTVTARDSKENPVLVKAGGNLTIQGDKSVDLLALNHPGQAFQSGGDLRLVSDGNVSGDAHFGSGGTFSIETLAGKPGNFVSLYDPIVSSGNDVSFGDYTGVSLKVESGGSITGGNITINSNDTSLTGTDADANTLKTSSALILRAGVELGNTTFSFVGDGNSADFTSGNLTTGTITLGSLTTLPFTTGGNGTPVINNAAGPIILAAPGDITVNGSVNAGNLAVSAGNTTVTSDIVFKGDLTTGGPISLDATGDITLGGSVNAGSLVVNSPVIDNNGNVTMHPVGNVTLNGLVGNAQTLSDLAINADNISLAGVGTTTQAGVTEHTILNAQGNITVSGSVNAGLLMVNTPGTATFNSSVLANNLTTDAGGLTVFNSNVTTVGDQTYSDNVQLNSSLALASAGRGSISFGGTVNSQPGETNSLIVNTNGGNVTLNGLVGNTQPLSNLTVNTTSGNTAAGNISLQGIGTTTQVGVTGNTNLQAPGTITFSGNTYNANTQTYSGGNIAVNGGNTTFTASSDPITFQGPITLGNSSLTIADASTIATDNIGGTGSINFTAGNTINTGNIAINGGAISLVAPQVVNLASASSGSGNITITSDEINFTGGGNTVVSGTGNLVLQPFTPSQAIAINGSADLGNASLDLTTADLSRLSDGFGNITIGRTDSTGNITIAAPTTFLDPLTLRTPGGSIFVNGQLTGGNNASLTFISSDTTTVLNADVITNGNPITFGNSVQLGNTVTVATNGGNIATGAPITFSNSVNATTAGAQGLTVNAGSGNASFNGSVGNTQPLSNLTVNAGNISLQGIGTTTQAGVTGNTNLQAPGTITFSGNTYNANTQTYSGGNIAVNGGNTIFKASSAPITFQGPIALGNSSLTIADASTIATDNIGGTGPINFTAANTINSSGNIATNGGNITLTSAGTITAKTIDSRKPTGNSNNGGAITLTHGGDTFIVNGSPGANDSSSGTISSRNDNFIDSGSFTGTYNQDNIAIIGPPITQPPITQPPITQPPPELQCYPPCPTPPTKPPSTVPGPPSTPILPSEVLSGEAVKLFENYYGATFNQEQFSLPELQDKLERLEKATGKKLAIINVDIESKIITLITPKDKIVVVIPLTVTSNALQDKANLLRSEIADPSKVTSSRYLVTSRQLYSWLIAPLEADLQAKKIDTLIFQLDTGLRLMPLAALNDGKQFLIEKYAISLIPSINLLDTSYDPERVRASKVLAMGASTFKDDVPLPAVPAELQNVVQETGGGDIFLNDKFTLGNLKAKTAGYGLIHLATHADFNRGPIQGSYIKLTDTRLGLNQIRDLGWSQQKIELLVLSACRTAFGDSNTELGFAGLAVGAGVKTSIATLWRSSDLGTFGLMSDFYEELKTAPIKADALRAAQVAMLRGDVRVENGQLRFKKATFPLPEDLKVLGEVRLTHPYYWSGFTMIGSPW